MGETAGILDFALALADEADAITLAYYRGELGTERKADGTLVTLADRAVEERLRQRIAERFPEHSILGEEHGWTPVADPGPRAASGGVLRQAQDERGPELARWIIDPIDGTNSFARNVPVWATLIAFERDGALEVGVASAPALGTRWWAARGGGAYRAPIGGAPQRIAVSLVGRVEEAQVLYGSHALALSRWPNGFEALLARAWRTRGYGDFWGHCLVAEGAAEVMVEGELSPWDIAAVQVIVEEAGGRLTDGAGTRTIDGGYAVTSNGTLHDEVLRVLAG